MTFCADMCKVLRGWLKAIVVTDSTPQEEVRGMPSDGGASGPEEFHFRGEFWARETPGQTSTGGLRCLPWAGPELNLDVPIIEQRSVRMQHGQIIHTGDHDDIVADFLPFTILGRLATDLDVTLFGSHGGFKDMNIAYRANYAIFGRHFDDPEVAYFTSIRFQLDNDSLWNHLLEQVQPSQTALGSLYCERETNAIWFRFVSSAPRSIGHLVRRALMASRTLARLSLNKDIVVGRAQVQSIDSADWLDCYTFTVSTNRVTRYIGERIVDPRELSLAIFGKWLELSSELDGLDSAIADSKWSPLLEPTTLSLGSIAEGLHRRLFPQSVRFPSLNKGNRKQVREAGQVAVSNEINKFELTTVPDDFQGLLAPLNDFTYKQRLEELQNVAEEAATGIVSPIADWPTLVSRVRNFLAHWPEEVKKSPPTINERLLANLSLQWVLRIVLLRKAEVSIGAIQDGCGENDEYQLYLANIRAHV